MVDWIVGVVWFVECGEVFMVDVEEVVKEGIVGVVVWYGNEC